MIVKFVRLVSHKVKSKLYKERSKPVKHIIYYK